MSNGTKLIGPVLISWRFLVRFYQIKLCGINKKNDYLSSASRVNSNVIKMGTAALLIGIHIISCKKIQSMLARQKVFLKF